MFRLKEIGETRKRYLDEVRETKEKAKKDLIIRFEPKDLHLFMYLHYNIREVIPIHFFNNIL